MQKTYGTNAEKYLALFTQSEPFIDWRRTGYPALVPDNGSSIPGRFLYPQSELDFNGPNVSNRHYSFLKSLVGSIKFK
jgi:hypothetical protein